MIKKLVIISFFTGSSQLLSLLVLKLLSQKHEFATLGKLGEVDALFQLILSVIALGLQSLAIRDMALAEDWKTEVQQHQSARVTMGLLLALFSIGSFVNKTYLIFLLSPLLALSADYSLYATGKAVVASAFAFIRVLVPYLFVMATIYFAPKMITYSYILGVFIIYIVTNLLITRIQKIDFFYKPNIKSFKLYITSISLGLVMLGLYCIGLGVLVIAPYFYSSDIISKSYSGLKFYIIFKGALRIIHQAFIKDMTRDDVCLKIDNLSIIAGIIFMCASIIFPSSFINIFLGKQYLKDSSYIILLGIAGLVYSNHLSATTRSILDKKDIPFLIVTSLAVIACFVTIIVLSYIGLGVNAIGISILTGEIVFSIGLLQITTIRKVLIDRAIFYIKYLPTLLIPLITKFYLGDNLIGFLTGMTGFAIIIFLIDREKFAVL